MEAHAIFFAFDFYHLLDIALVIRGIRANISYSYIYDLAYLPCQPELELNIILLTMMVQ